MLAKGKRREELLAGLVEELMVASDYSPDTMREANRRDLRLLFGRCRDSMSRLLDCCLPSREQLTPFVAIHPLAADEEDRFDLVFCERG